MEGILSICCLSKEQQKRLGIDGHDAQFPFEMEVENMEVVPSKDDEINFTYRGMNISVVVLSRKFVIHESGEQSVIISARALL